MKRIFVRTILLIVGLLLLLTNSGLAQQKLAPYVIGVVTDLTGRMSDMGIANKRGVEIAVEAVNAAGGVNGRQLKIVMYDGEVIHRKALFTRKKLLMLTKPS